MLKIWVYLSAVLAVAFAKEIDYHAHPQYSFEYGVNDPHTHDVKKQWETRDGDKVQGSYSLKEADGTVRIVEYHANDHSGFNAVVRREGHAVHPQVGGHHGSAVHHEVSVHGPATSHQEVSVHPPVSTHHEVAVHAPVSTHHEVGVHPQVAAHPEVVLHAEVEAHTPVSIHPKVLTHPEVAVHPKVLAHPEVAVHPEVTIHQSTHPVEHHEPVGLPHISEHEVLIKQTV